MEIYLAKNEIRKYEYLDDVKVLQSFLYFNAKDCSRVCFFILFYFFLIFFILFF